MDGGMAGRRAQDMEDRISLLSDAQVDKTIVALVSVLGCRAREKYAADPERLARLERVALPGQPDEPLLEVPADDLAAVDRRALLIGLARQGEFYDELHQALQQAQFVAFTGLEPLIVAAVITFALSLKFDLTLDRAGGKTKFKIAIGKEATDVGFIGRLLGFGGANPPGSGSG